MPGGDVTVDEERFPVVPGYRLLRRIGAGGFSVVYEAVQESLDRRVAVKVLMVDLGREGDRLRFDRERAALSRLGDHPHVVDVVDAGVTGDGRPYLVMRLYPGGTVAELVAAQGRLAPERVVALLRGVAAALDFAHAEGLLHRDVNPRNLLLSATGDALLADFGIAALADGGGATTTFFTAAHAAPEVLESGDHSVGSDVYSLASTAYAMLCGAAPFGESLTGRQLMVKLTQDAPRLGDVPGQVRDAVAAGLARTPDARPASAGAFVESLAATARRVIVLPEHSAPSAPAVASPHPPGPPAGAEVDPLLEDPALRSGLTQVGPARPSGIRGSARPAAGSSGSPAAGKPSSAPARFVPGPPEGWQGSASGRDAGDPLYADPALRAGLTQIGPDVVRRRPVPAPTASRAGRPGPPFLAVWWVVAAVLFVLCVSLACWGIWQTNRDRSSGAEGSTANFAVRLE